MVTVLGVILVILGIFVAESNPTVDWKVIVGFCLTNLGVICLVFAALGVAI